MSLCSCFLLLMTISLASSMELGHSFTGYVNLEKMYTLEDELIMLSDVILKLEMNLHGDEDVHNISSISSTIEAVKDIHREVMESKNYTTYIVHPINVYHMVKRLVTDWSPVIQTIRDSKSCRSVMQDKVKNIANNLPSERHLKSVSESIVRIQVLHNLSADDVISGDVMGSSALSPLSLDEAFQIAQVAFDVNEFKIAVDWLNLVMAKFSEENATVTKRNVHSLLSSALYKLERMDEAIDALEAILKIDPDNVSAKRNKRFIEQKKADTGVDGRNTINKQTKRKVDRLVEQLCIGNILPNTKKESRLFCKYFEEDRVSRMFHKPTVAGEVLSRRPLIILFHNMTTLSQQKAVRHLGYDKMRDLMFKNQYSHREGIQSMMIQDLTRWRWVPNLIRNLTSIPLSDYTPDQSQFMVHNVGMSGSKSDKIMPYRKYRLGTFMVFLSQPNYGGGHVVFPFANVRVEPPAGGVLFYETKAHNQATVCPVVSDTMWVGTYPLVDKRAKTVCQEDPLIRPKP